MIDRVAYTITFVKDFGRALAFYRDTVGLPLAFADEKVGHATFSTEGAQFKIQRVEGLQASYAGRHSGTGFTTKDLDAEYARLKAKGVVFTLVPEKMPWGSYMAMFQDPDGNVHYLDQRQ